MTDIPHEIGLRFGALAPSLSEQIIAQIPDIVERMGESLWKNRSSQWEKLTRNISSLYLFGLITDSEKDKAIARLNRLIIKDLKGVCRSKRKKASGGDPA